MFGRLGILALAFGSGACALAYQVTWLREFRLLFGASTGASASVLAIFIGGLGAGSWVLGPRVDRTKKPLAYYAVLEAFIAVSAAATPLLLALARYVYLSAGGSSVLGLFGATLARLVLAALVLAVPTFLMGGTLPAAARALEGKTSNGRRNTALLYGCNTLGAVVGAFYTNFVLLERLGNMRSLWLAAGLNLCVAGLAFWFRDKRTSEPDDERPKGTSPAFDAHRRFVLGAAAGVGFVFFLMELVWYRLLAPLLGGTVFTMGLILTLALLGVGIGGVCYGRSERRVRVTLGLLGTSCALEAMLLLIPYALGDRIAIWAALLQNFGHLGFAGQALGWSAIAGLVILPGATVAGYQFPLLIALLGRGRRGIGRDAGRAYALNTGGAMVGSLAGGFGLMPALGAPGCWLVAGGVLVALGLGCWYFEIRAAPGSESSADTRPSEARLNPFIPLMISAAALALMSAQGPGPLWRHSGIGVGRYQDNDLSTPNSIRAFQLRQQRAVIWEKDGVESSVALMRLQGRAFVVNGKIDGHATLDAPTQIMSGILGAMLHPHPTRALVIGLGTGSTAGWLGLIDTMQRVDVSELEPAIVSVAKDCSDVNGQVLDNSKVNIVFGDARELLLTTRETYDVIFSEPSNPYRAGIASLFTKDFYAAVKTRLAKAGVFVQWVQAYEINPSAVELVYATMASEFPHIETWRTHRDLLLVASSEPSSLTISDLVARMAQDPYASALREAWQVDDVEGLFSYYVANSSFAKDLADAHAGPLNTDDRNLLEFDFARSVGQGDLFSLESAFELARSRQQDRPANLDSGVQWASVQAERNRLYASVGQRARMSRGGISDMQDASLMALMDRARWVGPSNEQDARRMASALQPSSPEEAAIVFAESQANRAQAFPLIEEALLRHRTNPWVDPEVVRRAVHLAVRAAREHPGLADRATALLATPFAMDAVNETRQQALLDLSLRTSVKPACVDALRPFEPNVVWEAYFLKQRLKCYEATGHRLARSARRDLSAFERMSAPEFGSALKAK